MFASKLVWAAGVVVLIQIMGSVLSAGPQETNETADEIFETRILPILKSPKPSSCTECHLSGVDLKDYLDSDPARTFASMRKAGLVDIENPEKSKILKLINMKPEKANPISAKMRKMEYDAFLAWIVEAVKNPEQGGAVEKPLGPSVPMNVIRHARRDRLLASFMENVWAERNRCFSCHGPNKLPNPKQQARKEELIEKHGREAMIWFVSEDPAESMDHLLKSRILDLKNPAKSLIVTKPTMQVKHGGHIKMFVGDRAYRQFIRFIEDYAKIKSGEYRTEEDLPAYIMTKQWLRVTRMPVLKPLIMQVDVYRKEGKGWSEKPIATAVDRSIVMRKAKPPKKLWQAPLELTVPRSGEEFEKWSETRRLPPGTYQLRFYIDRKEKLNKNPSYRFTKGDLSGITEIEVKDWPEREARKPGKKPEGWKPAAKEIPFPRRKRK